MNIPAIINRMYRGLSGFENPVCNITGPKNIRNNVIPIVFKPSTNRSLFVLGVSI